MTEPTEPSASADPVATEPTEPPVSADPVATETAPAPPGKPADKPSSFLRELPILIAVALVLALLIKAFLVQAFFIPSESMEDTLKKGDRVLVNKLVYHTRSIHRGEVVVFNGKDTSFESTPEFTGTHSNNPIARFFRSIGSAIGIAPPGEKDFIKRVIGVGGDRVACCTNGKVTVNGVPLNETYLKPGVAPSDQQFDVVVPKDHLWVMGDNRANSSDSRFHINDADHGYIPTHKVIGRAFIKVWPFSHFGVLHVPKTFNQKALHSITAPFGGESTVALGTIGALPIMAARRRWRARRTRRADTGRPRASVVP
ncbi:MAG: signal peptidase [Frankiaceae bacterium]|jgi:signal peptidase I|nr:signal peptidase [Frankiaceae bacterium]